MEGLKGIANCEPAIEIRRRDFGMECIKILQYKSNNIYFQFKWSELGYYCYCVRRSVIRLSVHIKPPPPSALVGTERRDLRVDYLSGIDWFCLDGLYVIKAAAIVAISL